MEYRHVASIMLLTLTDSQRATVSDALRPGTVLLARITREQFDDSNAAESGRLVVEFAAVRESILPDLRALVKRHHIPSSEPAIQT